MEIQTGHLIREVQAQQWGSVSNEGFIGMSLLSTKRPDWMVYLEGKV